MSQPNASTRRRFPARHRLTHAREFDAVYDAKLRKSRGPLVVFTRPNDRNHHRLGLAVSARLGGAVLRNKLKRLIREAFRLEHPDWQLAIRDQDPPCAGLDIIVSVRGAKPLPLDDYRTLLRELVAEAATEWRRRNRRARSEEEAT